MRTCVQAESTTEATMAEEAAARQEQVVDMIDFLRDTIAEIDDSIKDQQRRRNGLAVRLAALQAAGDPSVRVAADDYAARVEADEPYEDAEDAKELLGRAYKRFVQPD
jgi:hypothetical protein